MLGQWTKKFENHILQRGYDIYYHGHVIEKKIEDGKAIYQVRGKKDYQVVIQLKNRKPTSIRCNCPYASEGHLCKHEAAALLHYNNQEMPIKTHFASGEEIISMMDDKTKDEILIKLLNRDYRLLSEANEYFFNTQDDFSTASLILNGIFMDYGFQNDDNAFDKKILEFIHSYIIENQNLKSRWFLLRHLLSRLNCMEKHRFYRIENEAIQCLEELIDYPDFTKNIFDFLMEDSWNEVYLDFLFDHFRYEPYLQLKKEMIDRLISKTAAFEAWAKEYYLEYYLVKKLQVLYDQKNRCEIEQLTNQYWHYPKIREFWIEESIASKRYSRAIEIIHLSKKIDISQPSLQIKYERQLLDLYELSRHPHYFKQLREMLFKIDPGDFDDYLRFKSICPNDKWPHYQRLLLNTQMKTERLLEILLAEKVYDRLFKLILKEENIYFLERNRAIFLRECPNMLVDCYIDLVLQIASHASCREEYQQIVSLLKKILIMNDGREKVELVKANLRDICPKNHILQEQLNHI